MTATTNQSSNTFALFNTQAGLTKTNVLSSQPRLTIGSSLLLVTNHLNLTASSVLNFFLGTNAATIGVRNNLALAGTINVADGGGLTNASYILFTNGGTFTWNNPVVGTKPEGSTCTLDTGTAGQVKLVVTVPTEPALEPPAILGQEFLDGTFRLAFTGPAGQTYQILTSTNPALAMESWTMLTNGTFPASGPFSYTPAANDWVRFYRVVSP